MATSGVYGFRKNRRDKITYNHSDSYPNYLGKHMVEFIQSTTIKEMNEVAREIVLVSVTPPTEAQIAECNKFSDLTVSTHKREDWYCLLKKAQGNLSHYLTGLRYMIDNSEFIKDSLFCEFGYIINLDTNKLEFWRGFQTEPSGSNRYGVTATETLSNKKYYPCKMLAEFDLQKIIDGELSTNDIVNEMNNLCGYGQED